MSQKIHIIHHTHWDREWFLTSVYTSQWIPNLINRLDDLSEKNQDYRFLLDGQTLVIEDLLAIAPQYQAKVENLIKSGTLHIGPYYCQPDWRLTGGESLLRNIFYGLQDVRKSGGSGSVGWLVDNFGHISQAPQLHRLFDIGSVYVWRGVPALEPYFQWRGANGGRLFTINLFGGYRNLYGVTQVPELAVERLKTEVSRLKPFYCTDDIPLFDGYDLELNPEDALLFYKQLEAEIPEDLTLCPSSAGGFADEVSEKLSDLPVIEGELNSGKYGAIFPGTLTTRTYLKIMNHDCEHMLYRLCEPLAVMARLKGREYPAQQFETWGRALLQNTVHDCICGVSIDQVHEKMVFSYAGLFQALGQQIETSAEHILNGFAPGKYAISTSPFDYEGWQVLDDHVYHIRTNGIGVWPVGQDEPLAHPDEPVETFHWENDHYSATVTEDGVVHIGEAALGYLVLTEECGDTYSDEVGSRQERVSKNGPLVIEGRSEHFCQVRFDCSLQWEDVKVSARVRLIFDRTAMLRWQVELDSSGTNFRIEMVFETAQKGEVYAGMPFDVVKRPLTDTDLLPRQISADLADVLRGQRELNEVATFPFQGFVGVSDGSSSAIVFARGLRAYRAEENGTLCLPLRRSVEWLTLPNLENRVGDAGPSMYVPDARCERTVQHELGIVIANIDIRDMAVHRLNDAFQNPPLIADADGPGEQTDWQVLQEDLPMSSMQIVNQAVLARFYNPTGKVRQLNRTYQKTDVWGKVMFDARDVSAKEITTLQIVKPLPVPVETSLNKKNTVLTNLPEWCIGENQGHPAMEIIKDLKVRAAQLEVQLAQIEKELGEKEIDDRYRLQHSYYVLKRELCEMRLSIMLNEKELKLSKVSNHAFLYSYDQELAQLGLELNEMRIKRRIYDYIVETIR